MANLPVSSTLSTASQLSLLAETITRPTALNGTTNLLTVAECNWLITASSAQPKATDSEAIGLVRALVSLYRKADFEDPDVFSTALCAVFAEYPVSIGRQAIDPVKGLPSRLKFPPAIAEVKGALDEALNRRRLIAFRAKWMLDERARREAEARRLKENAAVPPERKAELAAALQGVFDRNCVGEKQGKAA